nr:MAG TPA: hypothetical protein [Bacteriophage sp.]
MAGCVGFIREHASRPLNTLKFLRVKARYISGLKFILNLRIKQLFYHLLPGGRR